MDNEITQRDTWNIIQSYFNEKGLSNQQTESFDEFFEIMKKIVESCNIKIEIENNKYEYIFKKCIIGKPIIVEFGGEITHMTPHMARIRSLTYDVNIYSEIEIRKYLNNLNIESYTEMIKLCQIPLMLNTKNCILYGKSRIEKIKLGECEFDDGGYFIVNGSEKVLIAQERMATNQVYVFLNKYNQFVAEIRSVKEGSFKSASQVNIKYLQLPKKKTIVSDKVFRVQIPYIKKDIPLVILLIALGIKKEEIYNLCIYTQNEEYIKILLEGSFDENFIVQTQFEALDYIGKRLINMYDEMEKRIETSKKILEKDFIPHVSTDSLEQSGYIKGLFIGYAVNKLCRVIKGELELDDRDHYGNKRLDLAGNLLGNLFRISFQKVIKEFKLISEKNLILNKPINIKNDLNGKDITRDIKYALSTGNWGGGKNKLSRTGVAQVLNRLSYNSMISHLRRVVAPLSKDGKVAKPRQLHPTSFMLTCCLTGDTDILMGDGSLKRIDSLKNNDIVVTVNPKTLKQEISMIYNWFELIPKRLLKIKTSSGREIKCTDDHPILVYNKETKKQEWINAGNLKIDNYLIEINNYLPDIGIGENVSETCSVSFINIVSIEEIEIEPVYDFTTRSNNHSFIANGIVVSNCSETPEGHACGLVKNLSLITHISLSTSSDSIECLISTLDIIPIKDIKPSDLKYENGKGVKIFLNGNWIGVCKNDDIEQKLIDYRRCGIIRYDISIRKINRDIFIDTDGGRCLAPKLVNDISLNNEIIIKTNKNDIHDIKENKKSWSNLVNEGKIEYLDVYEQSNKFIAMNIKDIAEIQENKSNYQMKYTHTEIHPSLFLGICASIIPYPEHNQAPRITYSAAQTKQAMGIYATSYQSRMDTLAHVLFYPQKPLIQTKQAKFLHYDQIPSGQNLIVAVACHTGYKRLRFCTSRIKDTASLWYYRQYCQIDGKIQKFKNIFK